MRANINLHNMDYKKAFPSIKDNQYGLAIVDPPYFDGPNKLGYFGASVSSVGVIRNGYKFTEFWDVPDQAYFKELSRVSENQIIWGINYYNIMNVGSGRIIWDKCNSESTFSDCEIAYCSTHASVRMFRYMWNGFMQGKSIEEGHIQQGNKRLNEKRIHPTQKPVALYKWLLQNYAKEGDKILDTHGGSMSIAIACWDLKIDLDIYEIDKECYESGTNRFNNHCKQGQLF